MDEVLEAITEQNPLLIVDGSEQELVFFMQNDNDFLSIAVVLKNSPRHLIELCITQIPISEIALQYLSEGIEQNNIISKIALTHLSLSYSRSFVSLIAALQECISLECLDFSNNLLNDDTGSFISELIRVPKDSSLRLLILDFNKFKDFSFAVSLAKNKSLLHFSINHNPLEFVNIVSLLEMLALNKTLQHLGVKGMNYKGPAPIKENPSGLLSSQEAITLKLTNVLRYSYICSISIDLDPSTTMQLRELETILTKHNRTLMKIESPLINWAVTSGPLLGIYKGLKANIWLSDRNTEMPNDLEDVINMKLVNKRNSSISSTDNLRSPLRSAKKIPISRKDSVESRNSDSTVMEGKSIKEMSFGKSALSKHFKEDDTFMKCLQSMNSKIMGLEEKFLTYTTKTDSYLEKVEAQVSSSKRSDDMDSVSKALKDIQSRLDKFEKDKASQNEVVDGYIQKLQSLQFYMEALESSRRSSRRLRPQKKLVKDSIEFNELRSFEGTEQSLQSDHKDRVMKLEERIQKIEQDSNKLNKVRQKLKGTMVKTIQDRVVRLENLSQDTAHTPKKLTKREMQSTQKNLEGLGQLPVESESVVISALMEKARYSQMNDSLRRSRSPLISNKETRRVPSTELKQCLKSRGFILEGDRPVFRKYNPSH